MLEYRQKRYFSVIVIFLHTNVFPTHARTVKNANDDEDPNHLVRRQNTQVETIVSPI